MSARPMHADAERESARRGLDKRLDVLAKKDALSEKASQVKCIDVTAHQDIFFRFSPVWYRTLSSRPTTV